MSTAALMAGRRARTRNRSIRLAIIALAVVVVFIISLMIGNTFYSLDQVVRVVLGQQVAGASFTVGELRLPRATLGLLAGFSFGVAGITFQTLLRNPLASPDIIGISSGASAAAVVGIVVFSFNETTVSLLALVAALVTAGTIYLLANRRGFAGTRLILIGIGVAAVLDSIVSYVLSHAAAWDVQTAMRWLTGSLNGASWTATVPVFVACAILGPLLLVQGRDLGPIRLGDDSASSLGVHVQRTRVLLILAAVSLLAVATAATGPIAFVAFMAGPIAARIAGAGASLLLPSGFVGALLVLVADLAGRFAFDGRYPVGVITGVIGAPYLVFLLIRSNRTGGSI